MITVPNTAATADLAKAIKTSKTDEEQLKSACQGFEAMLMHKMMQTMREATEEGGLIPKSNGEKIFTDLMDEEMCNIAATQSVNGIADALFNQLSPTLLGTDEQPASAQQKGLDYMNKINNLKKESTINTLS